MIAMLCALILLLVTVLITFNHIVLPIEVFAVSPSFTDREITDKPRDWLDLKTRNSPKDADFSTDILRCRLLQQWENLECNILVVRPI